MLYYYFALFGAGSVLLIAMIRMLASRDEKYKKYLDMIDRGEYNLIKSQVFSQLKKDKDNFWLLFIAARIYEKEKNYKEAASIYKRLFIMNSVKRYVKRPEIEHMLARCLYKSGKVEDAIFIYDIILKDFPLDKEALINTGKIYIEKKNYKRAYNYLKKITEQENSDVEFLKVVCFYNIGKYDKAIDICNRVVERDPQPRFYYYLGLIHKKYKDYDIADEYFSNASKSPEYLALALKEKGDCYFLKGELNTAILLYEKALASYKASDRNFDELLVYYRLGLAYIEREDIVKAMSYFEKIRGINPGYKDVARKLKQFDIFREHKGISSFYFCNTREFADYVRKILERLDFYIYNMSMVRREEAGLLALKDDNIYYVSFIRSLKPIDENKIRSIYNNLKIKRIKKAIVFYIGEITTSAIGYAAMRNIEIFSKQRLISIIEDIHASNNSVSNHQAA